MDRIRRHFNVGSTTRSSNIKSRDSIGLTGTLQIVFGASLEEISARCGLTSGVPRPFASMISALDKRALEIEGIFRVNGNARIIESLRQEFDATGDADLNNCTDIYAIAGALKLFLRELPNGLVSSSFTTQFTAVVDAANRNTLSKGVDYYTTTGSSDLSGCSSSDGSSGSRNPSITSIQCLEKYSHILLKLPEMNRRTLAFLCRFLNRVADPRYLNKMNAVSLAICFGPNVFRCTNSLIAAEHGGGGGGGGSLQGLRDQSLSNQVMAHFIEHYDQLFASILAPKPAPVVLPLSALTDFGVTADNVSVDSFSRRKRRCRQRRTGSRDKVKQNSQEDTQSSGSSSSSGSIPPLCLNGSFDNLLADEDLAIFMPKGLMTAASASSASTTTNLNLNNLVDVVAVTSSVVSKPCKKATSTTTINSSNILASPEVTPVDCMRIRERIAAAEAERLKESTSIELLQECTSFVQSRDPKPKKRLSLTSTIDSRDMQLDGSSTFCDSAVEPMLCDSISNSASLPLKKLNGGWISCDADKLSPEGAAMVMSTMQSCEKLFSLRNTIRSIVALNIFGSAEEAETVLDYSNERAFDYVSSDATPTELAHLACDPRLGISAKQTAILPHTKKSIVFGTHKDTLERGQLLSKKSTSMDRCTFPSSSLEDPIYSSSSSSTSTNDSINSSSKHRATVCQHMLELESTLSNKKMTEPTFEVPRDSRNDRSALSRRVKQQDTFLKFKPSNSKISDDSNHLHNVTTSSSLRKSVTHTNRVNADLNLTTVAQKFPTMMDTLEYINVHLQSKRLEADRPELLSAMTLSQVNDEKLALQKALLIFEQTHGRPKSNSDKEVMKPLYDRYRAVKRLLSGKQSSLISVDSDSACNHQMPESERNGCKETVVVPSIKHVQDAAMLTELLDERNCVEANKKTLQKQLKLFEKSFEEKTGRPMMREDRVHMASEYSRYKQIKVRLKHLNDLIEKNAR